MRGEQTEPIKSFNKQLVKKLMWTSFPFDRKING